MDYRFLPTDAKIFFWGVIVTFVIVAVDVGDRDLEGGRSFHVISNTRYSEVSEMVGDEIRGGI